MLPPVEQREAIKAKAEQRGINLTEDHWRLIEVSYAYYQKHQTICTLRKLIKLSGLEKKGSTNSFPVTLLARSVRLPACLCPRSVKF